MTLDGRLTALRVVAKQSAWKVYDLKGHSVSEYPANYFREASNLLKNENVLLTTARDLNMLAISGDYSDHYCIGVSCSLLQDSSLLTASSNFRALHYQF